MMAFRFRKFQHSLRLIPSTKSSLGLSTRFSEGDQTKGSSSLEPSKHECQGHFDASGVTCQGQNLYPLARTVSQPDALQPIEVSAKHNNSAIISLPQIKTAIQCSFDDLDLILATATKPVTFNCDVILPDSEDSCDRISSPCDLTWERTSLRMVSPSWHVRGSQESTRKRNCQDFSDNQSDSDYLHFTSNFDTKKSCNISDSNNFHAYLFSPPNPNDSSSGGDTQKDGPSPEQLHNARVRIEKTIPLMFSGRYDYSILHKNVVFENNLFGSNRINRGINAYALEIMKLRFRFYARYTSTQTEILNVTTQEQSGVIRVHWRLKGLPQTQVLKFWRLFQTKSEINKDDWEWFEAFSYFHIGKDGLVHKHRIDRMLPDNEEPSKLSAKLNKLFNPAKPLVN